MKMIFRNKHNGRFLTPIEVLPNYVRMYHETSDRVYWYKKASLHEHLQVVHHDVRVGDVLRDARDGQLWIVEYAGINNLRMQTRMGGVSGNMIRCMTYFELIHYERVGRKYCLRNRQPHERVEFRKTKHTYATYDASKVRQHIDNARAQAAAMIQAGNDAKRFGIGVLLVYPDGSMKSTDPRGVILK